MLDKEPIKIVEINYNLTKIKKSVVVIKSNFQILTGFQMMVLYGSQNNGFQQKMSMQILIF